MYLYNLYQTLKEEKLINRTTVINIDNLTGNRLSKKIPIGSFTNIKSTVNYEKVLAFIESELGIDKEYNLNTTELNNALVKLNNLIGKLPDEKSLSKIKETCDENICIKYDVYKDSIINFIYKMKNDYNKASIIKHNDYPIVPNYNLKFKNINDISVTSLIELIKRTPYDKIYNDILDGKIKDRVTIKKMYDLLTNPNTFYLLELIIEVSNNDNTVT